MGCSTSAVRAGFNLLGVLLLLLPTPLPANAGNNFIEGSRPIQTQKWQVVVGEDSSRPPAGRKDEVGPEGGVVEDKKSEISISIPPGALRQRVPITIKKSAAKIELDRKSSIPAEAVKIAASAELEPSGTRFLRPVEITMPIDPATRQKLTKGYKLVIAVANGDHIEQVERYRIDQKGRVHFQLEHFSSAYVFTILGLTAVAVLAMAGRLIATDSPHLMITPFHKNIQEFIKQGNMSLPRHINPAGVTDLGIKKTFKGTTSSMKTINSAAEIVKMEDGSKVNCQDLTFLAASLLLGSKDPRFQHLICVGGKASVGNAHGDHMWIEIEIDNHIYVVDTANPQKFILLPKSEARKKYHLKPIFEFSYNLRRREYKGLTNTSDAPTQAQLNRAYKDGYDMGCRHQSLSPTAIKQELREVYGKIKSSTLKKKFREGYLKGGEECRSQR